MDSKGEGARISGVTQMLVLVTLPHPAQCEPVTFRGGGGKCQSTSKFSAVSYCVLCDSAIGRGLALTQAKIGSPMLSLLINFSCPTFLNARAKIRDQLQHCQCLEVYFTVVIIFLKTDKSFQIWLKFPPSVSSNKWSKHDRTTQ